MVKISDRALESIVTAIIDDMDTLYRKEEASFKENGRNKFQWELLKQVAQVYDILEMTVSQISTGDNDDIILRANERVDGHAEKLLAKWDAMTAKKPEEEESFSPYALANKEGLEALEEAIADMDLKQLKQAIKTDNLDPYKQYTRSKDLEKLKKLILVNVESRLNHGLGFMN